MCAERRVSGAWRLTGFSCRDVTGIDHLSPARCPPGERDRRNRSSMWTERSNGAAGGVRGDTLGCPGPDGGQERPHKRRETNKSLINIPVQEQKHNTEFLRRASGHELDAAVESILSERHQGAQFHPFSATQNIRCLCFSQCYKLMHTFTGLAMLTPQQGSWTTHLGGI